MNTSFADGAVFCGVISGADKIKYMRLVMELLMKGGQNNKIQNGKIYMSGIVKRLITMKKNAVLHVYQRGYTGSYGVICYDMALDVSVCNKIK